MSGRHPLRYAGNELDAFEKTMKLHEPAWKACDRRAMMHGHQADGAWRRKRTSNP